MRRGLLLVTSALAALATGGAALAADDSGEAQAQAQTQTAQNSGNTTNVGEVIVQANKRNESVEDVPVAVTAFTPEQRDIEGVVSIFDITRATPSLEYSTAIDRVFIRGIGRNTNAPGTQAGVALYIDGVYSPSTYGLDRAPILSGNVETDAGPQGTLFGRNSIGGVIQQNTVHPTDQFEVKADVRYNDHNRIDIAETIGGKVNDHLNLLFGADYRSQTKGYFYNEALNNYTGGPTTERVNFAVGDYKWGNFEGFAKVEFYGYNRKLDQYSQYGATFSDEAARFNDYTSNNGIGVTQTFNCAMTNQATPGNPLNVTNPFTVQAVVNCPGNVAQATAYYDPTNPTFSNPFLIKQDYQTTFKSHNDWDTVDQTTWHAPWFDLKYIGGYSQYIYDNHQDYDNTARGVFQFDPDGPTGSSTINTATGSQTLNLPAVSLDPELYDYFENRKWYSHELDLTNKDKGPLNWIVGLYYYHDNFLNTTAINAPGQTQLASAYNPVTTLTTANPNLNYYSTSGDAITASQAIFGQVEWDVTPKWKLTGGVRYNHDSVSTVESDHYYEFVPGAQPFFEPTNNYNPANGQYSAADYSNIYVPGTCTPTGVPAITSTGANCTYTASTNSRYISDSWGGWGGTANLTYKPNDGSLVYLKYSRGYKAGGIVVSGGMSPQPILNPETLNSYEAGYKFSPSRTITINTDAYFYDYRNYQDFGTVPTGLTTPATVTEGFNVPKSRNYGLEVSGDWHPIHAFTLNFSGDLMDAKVTDGGSVALVDGIDPKANGNVLITQPDGTMRTYTYTPKPCGGTVLGTANIGGFVQTVQEQPQCITGDALKGASPWKLWLSPDYRFDFEKGSLDLAVTYSIRAGNVSTYTKDPVFKAPSYSEVDLRGVWHAAGGKYSFIAFVNNVANMGGTEFVLAGTNIDGSKYLENVLTVPRTWGLELQAKF